MEDCAIIDLYWSRNPEAISRTCEKYGNYCRAVAGNILPDCRDAEECVNDTWLKAWNAMPEDRPNLLAQYLGKITRNLALNRLDYNRAQKRDSTLEAAFEELSGSLPDPGDMVTDEVTFRDFLNRFLRRQSEADRALFVRRYFHLEPLDSLARQFGMSMGQVKSKLHRMRGRLRLELEREGVAV